MTKEDYPVNCFSGQCGLCNECCSIIKYTSYVPEGLQRAEATKVFNETRMSSYCKKWGRVLYNKQLSATKKKIIDVKGAFPPRREAWELLDSPHGAICDDPVCKAVYASSDDGVHAMIYPNIPVYTRRTNDRSDDNCQLCIVCIEGKQPWCEEKAV